MHRGYVLAAITSLGSLALSGYTRHIGDFRDWENYGAYQQAFDRLLRDLKAAERQPEGSRPVG